MFGHVFVVIRIADDVSWSDGHETCCLQPVSTLFSRSTMIH